MPDTTRRRIGGAALAAVLLGVLLSFLIVAAGGCFTPPKDPKPAPTPEQLVEKAERRFNLVVLGVRLWELKTNPSQADRQRIERGIASGRAVIAGVRQGLADGKPFDLDAALRAIERAAFELLDVQGDV